MAKSGKTMLSGLSDKSPPAVDSSMKPPSGSVNSETTRKETAPQQATIGPRCA
jgi:hypothetical protein